MVEFSSVSCHLLHRLAVREDSPLVLRVFHLSENGFKDISKMVERIDKCMDNKRIFISKISFSGSYVLPFYLKHFFRTQNYIFSLTKNSNRA